MTSRVPQTAPRALAAAFSAAAILMIAPAAAQAQLANIAVDRDSIYEACLTAATTSQVADLDAQERERGCSCVADAAGALSDTQKGILVLALNQDEEQLAAYGPQLAPEDVEAFVAFLEGPFNDCDPEA